MYYILIYISHILVYIYYTYVFFSKCFLEIFIFWKKQINKKLHTVFCCVNIPNQNGTAEATWHKKKKHLYYITLIFSICSTKWITKSLRLEETSGVHLTQPHNHWKKGWDLLLQTSGATDTILTLYFRPCQVWQCPHGSHWFSQERTYSLTVTQHDLWLKPLRTWEVPWTNGYKILKQASSEERFSDLR